MPMSSDTRAALSRTIRALRDRLLTDLSNELTGRYRLEAPSAGLEEEEAVKRRRLEDWLDEQVRAEPAAARRTDKARADARARHLHRAMVRIGATWLNRLVVIRVLEAHGLSRPPVLTGGWRSKGYKEFVDFAPELVAEPGEGFDVLVELLCAELRAELPGLFGEVGLEELTPLPHGTLKAVVEALDHHDLAEAWTDDTTLGWVYQYWNDPERERLDAKLNGGGKVEPHEIASKTQMFTERYMVRWLLQNTVGPMWRAICRRNAWTPDCEAHGTLDDLDARRAAWRRARERAEVALDDLMPLRSPDEEAWAYHVPQDLPDALLDAAPDSLRGLRLLDPACGSGHFLIEAFGLLQHLYREEARHRHEPWTPDRIARWIVEDNLHGVDIDEGAAQIAAAALWLRARIAAPNVRLERINLVAPALRLSALPPDDPALLELQTRVADATGIPHHLTARIVEALAGADHLGTLLRVEDAVADAIAAWERTLATRVAPAQTSLFGPPPPQQVAIDFDASLAHRSILELLSRFLAAHQHGDDLGIRLRGQQLAAGVRFVQTVRHGAFHIVVGNPPYQGTSKMADTAYVEKHYPAGKADLYAAFLQRGLELVVPGGLSAMVTMRGWMFIKQFEGLRRHLLGSYDLRALQDVSSGAFEEISAAQVVVSVVLCIFSRAPADASTVAFKAFDEANVTQVGETGRKRAAVLAQVGRFDFEVETLRGIQGWPLIYWWDKEFLRRYVGAVKMGEVSPARKGICTSNDLRYLKRPWEVAPLEPEKLNSPEPRHAGTWVPSIHGAEGRAWCEQLDLVLKWSLNGLEQKVMQEWRWGSYSKRVQNQNFYFQPGVAFSMIGASFTARAHRYRSIFGNMGSSVFPPDIASTVCLMNSGYAREVMQSLNPGVHFEVGDVNRLPLIEIPESHAIFARIEAAFGEHESHREASVEFRAPGRSAWRYAQAWAQRAVDRGEGEALPAWAPKYEEAPAAEHITYAVGVALGRFHGDGSGVVTGSAPSESLAHGVLFVSGAGGEDDLGASACGALQAAWREHGGGLGTRPDLRGWLQHEFFKIHKGMYDNRPIFWPLSSSKRSFVAWASIHRWRDDTLETLLVERLLPESERLAQELDALRQTLADAEASGEGKARANAQKRIDGVLKLRDELDDFIAAVRALATTGPPLPDPRTPPREVDAAYRMDLDDGVMVNSAPLWPLLQPQWKDPQKWWKELATAHGRKDYDWSHLAARYWPTRVDGKCKLDPSLAVAHGTFWRYHPGKAFAWELRLQVELGEDFRLDEKGSDFARDTFLQQRPELAADLLAAELKRRERKSDSTPTNDDPEDDDDPQNELDVD